MLEGTRLITHFGVNWFVVKYPAIVREQYPDHVTAMTFLGRAINNMTIVSVNISMDHNREVRVGFRLFVTVNRCCGPRRHCCVALQVGGYIGWFDVRDPGTYTLQVSLSWLFGDSGLDGARPPIGVGSHGRPMFGLCDFRRSLVVGGAVSMTLPPWRPETAAAREAARFGTRKCTDGAAAGRWLWLQDDKCVPPYCTGNYTAVRFRDLVSRQPQGFLVLFVSLALGLHEGALYPPSYVGLLRLCCPQPPRRTKCPPVSGCGCHTPVTITCTV